MELFVTLIDSLKPQTNVTKSFFLDVVIVTMVLCQTINAIN